MWTAYLDTHPARARLTAALGLVSRRAYYGPFAPLTVRTVGRPALPGERWVRVRNSMAGVSSADVQAVHLEARPEVTAAAAPLPPRVYLGREVVGEVAEVGLAAQFFRPGDVVVYQTDQCCATRDIEPPCPQCAIGNYALCEHRFLPGLRSVGGGWSEEQVVHERQLFLVPDGLSDEQAVLIEPTAAAVHAAMRRLPQHGEKALIIGADAAGLLLTQAVQVLAPEGTPVAAVAHYPFQVELAARMGAGHVIYDEDLPAAVARIADARRLSGRGRPELFVGGFDVVYDAIGTAATLQQALRWAREGGTVVLAGRRPTPLTLDLTPIWYREVNLVGAWTHGTENAPGVRSASALGQSHGGREATFQLAARLMRERLLTPERLVTHRFPLREVRRAVETARDPALHRSIKVLLDMRDPTGLDSTVMPAIKLEQRG
jgi:threonine dehydrogenase-like Zn-dependent dehydrogenase